MAARCTFNRCFKLLALFDGVFDNGLIIHHSCDRASIEAVIHWSCIRESFDRVAVLALVFLKESLRSGTSFDTDGFALEFLVGLDIAAVLDCQDRVGCIVRVRIVKSFLAGICDRHAGDNSISLTGLNAINSCIKARVGYFHSKALVFGNSLNQLHVNPSVLVAVILEDKRSKRWVAGNDVFVFCWSSFLTSRSRSFWNSWVRAAFRSCPFINDFIQTAVFLHLCQSFVKLSN